MKDKASASGKATSRKLPLDGASFVPLPPFPVPLLDRRGTSPSLIQTNHIPSTAISLKDKLI